MDYKEAVKLCKSKKDDIEPEELIPFLKSKGFDILTSMKVLRESFDISLGQAKKIVAGHFVWKKKAKEADLLHEKLINKFKDEE